MNRGDRLYHPGIKKYVTITEVMRPGLVSVVDTYGNVRMVTVKWLTDFGWAKEDTYETNYSGTD